MPFYMMKHLDIFLYLLLVIVPILFLPRVYRYINKKYLIKIGANSTITDYINSIDFIKEDGVLREYYSVLYGGYSNNSNRLWILKFSTIYAMLIFIIGIVSPSILSSIKPDFTSSSVLKIISLFFLIVPIIFIAIHLIKIEHKLVSLFIVIYSLFFYLLTISAYLIIFILLTHYFLRFFKIILFAIFKTEGRVRYERYD